MKILDSNVQISSQEPNLDITLHIEANIDCLTFIDLAEVLQRGTANVEIDAYC